MEKQYKKVKALNKKDNVGIEFALCKLFEEAGELAQAVNMIIGRKATKLNLKEIKDNITEECADTIQNVFCIAEKTGITYKQLCDAFDKKNIKWQSRIKKQDISKVSKLKKKSQLVDIIID